MLSMSELLGRAHANGMAIAALAEILVVQNGNPGALAAMHDRLTQMLPAAVRRAAEISNEELARGMQEQMEFILGYLEGRATPPAPPPP